MTITFYSYLNSLAELSGRVFMDTTPSRPQTPYAIVWDAPGSIETEVFGGSDVARVMPRVTLYDKPSSDENTAASRVRLLRLAALVGRAIRHVNTHSDGATPYTLGSLRRVNSPAPIPDKNVQGQSYTTVMFTALIDRP